MKKSIKFLIVALMVIILAGCKNSKVITKCTMTSNQKASGYVLDTTYTIHSKNSIVNTVDVEQVIESKDKKVLDSFKKSLDNQYKNYNKLYGGYDYKIKVNSDNLVAKITINYNKLDLKKFISNNTSMKEYTKNGKITLDGIKKMYNSIGATCK